MRSLICITIIAALVGCTINNDPVFTTTGTGGETSGDSTSDGTGGDESSTGADSEADTTGEAGDSSGGGPSDEGGSTTGGGAVVCDDAICDDVATVAELLAECPVTECSAFCDAYSLNVFQQVFAFCLAELESCSNEADIRFCEAACAESQEACLDESCGENCLLEYETCMQGCSS